MKYKVVFCDIDGTLISMNNKISSQVKKSIADYIDSGGTFVLTTGREYSTTIDKIRDLGLVGKDGYAILSMGGTILSLKDLSIIKHLCFSQEDTIALLKVFENNDTYLQMADAKNTYYAFEAFQAEIWAMFDRPALDIFTCVNQKLSDYVRDNNTKVNKMFCIDVRRKVKKVTEIISQEFRDKIDVYADEIGLDIVVKGNSKGWAIRELLEKLNLKKEDSVGIGDSHNDIDMFKNVGISVAMGNAKKEIQDLANVIAPSVEKDGVAEILEKITSDQDLL
jgi:Cof subfamily protein (haloacid dehalogenase superfamily)